MKSNSRGCEACGKIANALCISLLLYQECFKLKPLNVTEHSGDNIVSILIDGGAMFGEMISQAVRG